MMIARHTGYEPGIFSHVVANEQIYDRHMDAANELINRYNSFGAKEHIDRNAGRRINAPHLELNPEKTNFYDFTIDDFTMVNYDPIKPQLKLELGI
jgi:thymidylate synthase